MTKEEAIYKLINSEISLDYIPQFNNDKEIVKVAVKYDGNSLAYAAEDLRNDKEIAMIAVSENGLALQYASEELKNNIEVVAAAVSKHCHALQYASEELKDNKVMKEIVTASNYFIEFLWDDYFKSSSRFIK